MRGATNRLVGFRVRSCRGGFARRDLFGGSKPIHREVQEAGSVHSGKRCAFQAGKAGAERSREQLRRIIGDIAIRGFSSQGKTNFDTLSTGGVGFGQLDGLAFSSQDGKAQFVVTTETLLHDWLRTHKNWWKKEKNAPQKVEDALKSEPFYTQAISTDAAVVKYAEVPVKKNASAQVVAILDARSQDMVPRTPDELIVS